MSPFTLRPMLKQEHIFSFSLSDSFNVFLNAYSQILLLLSRRHAIFNISMNEFI